MVYYFVFVLVYSFFLRSFSCNIFLAIVKKINTVEKYVCWNNTSSEYRWVVCHHTQTDIWAKIQTHKNEKKQKAFAQIRPINKYIVFIFISINIVFIIAISQNGLLVARISQATVVNLLSSSDCILLQLHCAVAVVAVFMPNGVYIQLENQGSFLSIPKQRLICLAQLFPFVSPLNLRFFHYFIWVENASLICRPYLKIKCIL